MLVEQKGALREATVSSLGTEGDSSALEVQIRLVGGIGVSVINSVPEELVFINLEQIQVYYSKIIIISLLRTFALIVSAHFFCASHVSVARANSRGPREEKCHAKVCKQVWRPRRKVKKEVKVGDS